MQQDTIQTVYAVNGPNVIRETFDGEVVIISLDTGSYYSLQASAAAIWEAIEAQATLEQILDQLNNRFLGDAQEMAACVRVFLDELRAEHLVVETPGGPGGPGALDQQAASVRIPFIAPSLAKFSDMEELLLLDPIHEVDETGWPARRTAEDVE